MPAATSRRSDVERVRSRPRPRPSRRAGRRSGRPCDRGSPWSRSARCMRPVASARRRSSAKAALAVRRRDVRRPDDDLRRARRAGEGLLDGAVGLHDRQAARQVVEAGHLQVHAERREREHQQDPGRAERGDERMAERGPQHGSPDARLAARALGALQQRAPISQPSERRAARAARSAQPEEPAASTASTPRSMRSPSLPSSAGSTVSEPTIAMNTTIIAPSAERGEDLVAGEQQPGHRDQHREARDEHRLARGRSGPPQRSRSGAWPAARSSRSRFT